MNNTPLNRASSWLRQAKTVVALSSMAVLIGCAATGTPTPNNANLLSSSDLEVLFSQPFSAEFLPTGSSAAAKTTYKPDGSATLRTSSRNEKGNWRVIDNQYCSSWENLRNKAESCFSFHRISPDIYNLTFKDKRAGKFTIRPEQLKAEELKIAFTGNTFKGESTENTPWEWTFREDGTTSQEPSQDWPDQTWAIEGDLLCRTKSDERPCVTVYRFGGLYQLGLQGSKKRESWWIHSMN